MVINMPGGSHPFDNMLEASTQLFTLILLFLSQINK